MHAYPADAPAGRGGGRCATPPPGSCSPPTAALREPGPPGPPAPTRPHEAACHRSGRAAAACRVRRPGELPRGRSGSARWPARPPAPGRAPRPRTPMSPSVWPPDRREIFLTYDDGPHPAHTPGILRILRRRTTPAPRSSSSARTPSEFPDLLRALADDGHAVANHTWTHPQLTTLPPGAVRSELGRTSDLIKGGRPRHALPTWPAPRCGDWDDPFAEHLQRPGHVPASAGRSTRRTGPPPGPRTSPPPSWTRCTPGRSCCRTTGAARQQPDRRGAGLVSAAAAGRRLPSGPYRALTRRPRGPAGPVAGASGHPGGRKPTQWFIVQFGSGCRHGIHGPHRPHRAPGPQPYGRPPPGEPPRSPPAPHEASPGRIPPFGRGFPLHRHHPPPAPTTRPSPLPGGPDSHRR